MQEIDHITLRQLSRRSDGRGSLQLALHCTQLAMTGWLVYSTRGTGWLPPVIVLHGVVLNFLFCALHETIHRTAFRNRWMNETVAWICGPLLLLPPGYFRLFHFAHHRYTQDPGHDPELAQPPPTTLGSYLWRATGLPNWHKRLTVTLRHALTGTVPEPFVPAPMRRMIVREARLLWCTYTAIFVLSILSRRPDALIYWVLPAVAGQPFLRLFLFAEHADCALTDSMYANTRTTYTNGALRLLAWQMPFHVEHHAFPAVPFHALSRLNALVRERIQVSSPGYLALHRSVIRRLMARAMVQRQQFHQ